MKKTPRQKISVGNFKYDGNLNFLLELERNAKQLKDHYINYLRPDINK